MKNTFAYVATVLVLLACIVRIASAEEIDYWTSNADLYYHSYAECLGESDRVPISATAADSFGKTMCPICAEADDMSTELIAASGHGMLLVRVPAGRLMQDLDHAELDFEPDIKEYRGEEALMRLAELHGGGDYARAMEAYAAGTLDSTALELTVRSVYDAWDTWNAYDLRNRRRLNGARYLLYSLGYDEDDAVDQSYEHIELTESRIWAENGALKMQYDGNSLYEESFPLKAEAMGDAEFTGEYGALSLRVYPALDAHAALVRMENWPDEEMDFRNTGLKIGAYETSIQMSGYGQTDNGRLTHVILHCILSDAELTALQSGAEAELVFR